MIKTIALSAGVERTVIANRKYLCVYIENQGNIDIYASKNPTIVADADDVMRIKPGETKQLLCESDKVYLLSSAITKAEILFSDYLNLNFRKYLKGGEKLILKKKYKLSELKTLNTVGTWTNNIYVEKGITFTVDTDFDDTVKTIKVNGTCSTTFNFTLRFQETAVELLTPGQMYLLSGCPSGGAEATYTLRLQQYKDNGDWFANLFENGNGLAIKPIYSKYNLVIRVGTGVVLNNAIYTPRLYKVLF